MSISGGYTDNDMRLQTEDLINNIGGGGEGGATAEKQDEQTGVLNDIKNNATYTNELLVDSVDGISTADLLVQLINLTRDNLSVKNSMLLSEKFDSGDGPVYDQYTQWLYDNPDAKIKFVNTVQDPDGNIVIIVTYIPAP